MAYEKLGGRPLEYYPCTYGASRLMFRGPKRDPEEAFIAFLGSTETYGKFVARPFVDQLEDMLDVQCLNLGVPNAGLDSFLNDATTLDIAAQASLTVVQIMGAQTISNRFYSVHPRRNDRFLGASKHLSAVYQDVDFTEFHFTNHMLAHLAGLGMERFTLVLHELQDAWVARTTLLLDRISGTKVLLWFADHGPEEKIGINHVTSSPFGVTQKMLDQVKMGASETVIVKASSAALARGNEGMVFAPLEVQATLQLLGPAAHTEAAFALQERLPAHLGAR
ncbi:hypothetical protein KO498_08030 [Lentibacter algarum]|uniref:DUF6473 family protein n=1 Tax=Lentibacter algarum TaxID=576131 RepID=UPI001C075764|nr:DUF6473 family protein [Lentibacter algarum]MBU2981762.1 hypothetical protein [Lentibacter algarum]